VQESFPEVFEVRKDGEDYRKAKVFRLKNSMFPDPIVGSPQWGDGAARSGDELGGELRDQLRPRGSGVLFWALSGGTEVARTMAGVGVHKSVLCSLLDCSPSSLHFRNQ
jgi:hypothetical protein